MVGWVVNRYRPVIKRYLNEDIYNLIKYGYFAIYKRPGTTCAEELEDLKTTISGGIRGDIIEDDKYLLRAGHGGILDSMATGVLVVALCDGCKVLPNLIQSNKRYTVTAQLGAATDSYNSSGNVVTEASYDHVTRPALENALKEFVGDIWQKPPVYSALKISGRRASDIAREGGEVNLVPRPVKCHAAHCLEFQPPYFTLDVSCGHGFYVRTLVHDLARAVGSCAHVTALERTKHGPFTVKDCLHSEDFSLDNIVSAISDARKKHPKLAQIIKDYWKENSEKSQKKWERVSKNNTFENKRTETKSIRRNKY